MTSLTFMLVRRAGAGLEDVDRELVVVPPRDDSGGRRDDRVALLGGRSRRGRRSTAAAAPLIRASASIERGSSGCPEIGKFSTARWVWARHMASAGTRTSPMESCSMRKPLMPTRLRGARRRASSGRRGPGAGRRVPAPPPRRRRRAGRRAGRAPAPRTRRPGPRPVTVALAPAAGTVGGRASALASWTRWAGPLSTSSRMTSYAAGVASATAVAMSATTTRARRSASSCRPWGTVPSRIQVTSAGSISTTSQCSTRRSPSTRSRVNPGPARRPGPGAGGRPARGPRRPGRAPTRARRCPSRTRRSPAAPGRSTRPGRGRRSRSTSSPCSDSLRATSTYSTGSTVGSPTRPDARGVGDGAVCGVDKSR